MRAIFDNRAVPEKIQQQLIEYYYKKLAKGIDVGYKPKLELYDANLVHALKTNIAKFSAFKETSFKQSLIGLLNETGKLPTWSEFRKRALETSNLYNVNWLNTEYHQTVATANMADKWQGFQETKELYPNLKYVTVGDERVRDKHKKWDGFIAPINHSIWQTIYPPNDWGCRCDVIASDDEPTKGYESFADDVKPEFANNPAITGEVFKNNIYEKGLSEQPKNNARKSLNTFIRNNTGIVKTKVKNLTIELGADIADLKRNYEVGLAIAEQTDHQLLIRKHSFVDNIKNPEYLFNNEFLGDRKSIEGADGILWQIDSSKKQMFHKSVNPTKTPYYIVWDLDLIENLEIETVIQRLKRKVTDTRGTSIKAMLFYYKGKVVELSRTEIVARDFTKLVGL